MAGLVTKRTGVRTRTKVAGAGLAVVAIVLIVLAAAGVYSSNASGEVKLVTTATASPSTPAAQTYPFGAPSGKPDSSVPQPAGQPTLVPTYGTKTTQRL
jgi:hypothetical protein